MNINIMEETIRKFCTITGVDADVITGSNTCKDICTLRYMLYAYLYSVKKISAPKIGVAFGRSRINVLRGIRILRGWMRYHSGLREQYQSITEQLEEAV